MIWVIPPLQYQIIVILVTVIGLFLFLLFFRLLSVQFLFALSVLIFFITSKYHLNISSQSHTAEDNIAPIAVPIPSHLSRIFHGVVSLAFSSVII